MPPASTLAHCAAVRRIDRCSSRSSGDTGGRPRPRFSCSMRESVNYLLGHNKSLAHQYLLNHNKYTPTNSQMQAMTQIVSAHQAIRMADTLKQRAATSTDLAALSGLKRTTVERWLSRLQMIDRVHIELASYRWVEATETEVAAFTRAIARHSHRAPVGSAG